MSSFLLFSGLLSLFSLGSSSLVVGFLALLARLGLQVNRHMIEALGLVCSAELTLTTFSAATLASPWAMMGSGFSFARWHLDCVAVETLRSLGRFSCRVQSRSVVAGIPGPQGRAGFIVKESR